MDHYYDRIFQSLRFEHSITREKSHKYTDFCHYKFLTPGMFFLLIFARHIIALQGCVGFCYTTAWISHQYTCVPFFRAALLVCIPPSLQVLTEHRAVTCSVPQLPAAAAAKSLQSRPTLRDHRQQPTRLPRPWDSPGESPGVGCHCLLHSFLLALYFTHGGWTPTGFLGCSVVKNLPASARDACSIPGWGRSLEKKWQLTPVFLPGKCRGQGSLVGYSPLGLKDDGYSLVTKE